MLPFENHSAQKQYGYLSASLTDELSNALARVRGLRVVSVPSIPPGVPDDRGLGQRLNVGSVLRGSVARAGQQLAPRPPVEQVGGQGGQEEEGLRAAVASA